jgi:signal peptidase II
MSSTDDLPPVPWTRHLAFWPLVGLGLAADLGSKHWMFSQAELLAGDVKWVWQGHAGFQLSLNEGALFGLGQGGVWVFAACSIAAAIAIPTWLFLFQGARDRALTLVLAAVMGGVLGNLYDRVGLPGLNWEEVPQSLNPRAHVAGRVHAVRDFVLLVRRWPPESRWDVWPNFNIADALLVCGGATIVLLSLRRPATQTTDASPAHP